MNGTDSDGKLTHATGITQRFPSQFRRFAYRTVAIFAETVILSIFSRDVRMRTRQGRARAPRIYL